MYQEGDWFGEIGALKGEKMAFGVKCDTTVSTLALETDTLGRFKDKIDISDIC